MKRKSLALLLLFVAVALVIVGAALWTSESRDVSSQNDARELVGGLANDPVFAATGHVTAHRGAPIALFVAGGASGLFGMLLIAGMSKEEWSEPVGSPDPDPEWRL